MTANQRRKLIEHLAAIAATRGLRLESRQQTKGKWVWDAVDARSGMVAAKGLRVDDLARYLDPDHQIRHRDTAVGSLRVTAEGSV